MSTRKKIETATDIWNAAIADTPIDDRGPHWSEQEPPWWAVCGVMACAIITNVVSIVVVVEIWNWITG